MSNAEIKTRLQSIQMLAAELLAKIDEPVKVLSTVKQDAKNAYLKSKNKRL